MVGAVEIEAVAATATATVSSGCVCSKQGGWGQREASDTCEGGRGPVKYLTVCYLQW